MPNSNSKSRQDLRSRFVRNAIPSETDFADLIAAGLNQADDGVLKLPDQPLGLVRQKPDQPVLRFYADPMAEGSAWQLQLGSGDKPSFSLAAADGKPALFVDGATGNVGIGIGAKRPEAALQIAGNLKVEAGSITLDRDQKVFFTDNGQIGGRDQYHQLLFRCTENITELREWGSIWLTAGNETCNNKPQIVVSQAEVKIGARLRISENNGTAANEVLGSLLLDHEDAGGASSIVFRSRVNRGSDYAFIEFRDKNPLIDDYEAALLTIGMHNDNNDHIALMPSGNVGVGTTTPSAKLQITGNACITSTEGINNACKSNRMAPGSLTIGGVDRNYGGGTGWNNNTAGLLLETLDNTEIAIHDSGLRLASFMYYESANNRFTIGRDMGSGAISVVNIQGNLQVNGNLKVAGKVDSQNVRKQVTANNQINMDTDTWTDMPQMIVTANIDGPVLVLFKAGGVQAQRVQADAQKNVRAYFRLLIDGNDKATATHEFHNDGWELRDVSIVWLESSLAVGNHEFKVQWRRGEHGRVTACGYGDLRSLIVVNL